MRRWLAAIAAGLCFAGSLVFLWWAHAVYMEFHGDAVRDDAALDYLLGFAPGGGILGMNADDYVEGRASVICDAAWGVGLAAALARLGWLRLRRFRHGSAPNEADAAPGRIMVVLRSAATLLLASMGLLLGWLSFVFCAPRTGGCSRAVACTSAIPSSWPSLVHWRCWRCWGRYGCCRDARAG
jgi:hypothetical protein